MPWFRRRLHEHDLAVLATIREEQRGLGAYLARICAQQEKIMIDTSKILAEVARERTELEGWKTLSAGKDKVIADTSAALKTATDALAAAGADTSALAQVQADLDKAAADLHNDNDAAEAAIKEGTPAAGG